MPDALSFADSRLKRIATGARALAVVYLLILFTGTHIPMATPPAIDMSDKILHFCGYFVLTLCALAGWELTVGELQPKHYFAVWLAGTVYGVFDEISQVAVGRSCDVNDWAADVLGIVVGLVVFRLCRRPFYAVLT